MRKQILIIKDLKQKLVEQLGETIKDVVLFGSQASGKSTENSDYDILIILKQNYDWKFRDRIYDVTYDISITYDIMFDVHLLSETEIKNSIRAKQPIFQNAITNGIYA